MKPDLPDLVEQRKHKVTPYLRHTGDGHRQIWKSSCVTPDRSCVARPSNFPANTCIVGRTCRCSVAAARAGARRPPGLWKSETVRSEHVDKVVELVGSSKEGIEDAVRNAVRRADGTLRNLRWFEVVQIRGHVEDGDVRHYQVVLKAGFTLEEGPS